MMQFEGRRDNPNGRFMTALLRANAVIIGVFTLVGYAAGLIDAASLVAGVIFLGLFSTIGTWSWQRFSKGDIAVDGEGITVTRRQLLGKWEEVYPWGDIARIHSISAPGGDRLSRYLWRLFSEREETPAVRIELRRMLRGGLLPFTKDVSTRGIGLPMFRRWAILYPEDVSGFLEGARLFGAAVEDSPSQPGDGIHWRKPEDGWP
jgi:hypothetical protein